MRGDFAFSLDWNTPLNQAPPLREKKISLGLSHPLVCFFFFNPPWGNTKQWTNNLTAFLIDHHVVFSTMKVDWSISHLNGSIKCIKAPLWVCIWVFYLNFKALQERIEKISSTFNLNRTKTADRLRIPLDLIVNFITVELDWKLSHPTTPPPNCA